MGKSGYKRFKKQEKAKVKLKGGKVLLPKGQNVTDTNFKVKKIMVKEQLKDHSEHDLPFRKHLNIKELISRLSHHNVSMRLEALSSLRELTVTNGSQHILPNLSSLMQATMSLCVDLESEVRRDTIKLLSAVFKNITEEELSPIFSLVICHLMCAMTHLDHSVRADSLKLMDVLLAAVPSLTATHTATLLPHFLDLISQRKDRNGEQGRSLSLQLDGQVTSEKWRARVIGRLNKLFKVIIEYRTKGGSEIRTVKLEADKRIFIDLYIPGVSSISSKDAVTHLPIQEYASTLMPLLLDTFIEAVPKYDQKDSQTACLVGMDVAALLQSIIQIILHMWNLLQNPPMDKSAGRNMKSWFRQVWGQQIITHLVQERFPYSVSAANCRKRKREAEQMLAALQFSDNHEPLCSLLNTQLCLLTFLFSTSGELWARSIQYIKCNLRRGQLRREESEVLYQCLESVSDHPILTSTPSLLEVMSKYGFIAPDTQTFHFLSRIALLPSHHLHQDKHFKMWLDSLPALLCNPGLSLSTIRSVAHIASHKLPAFSNSLDGWYEEIISNLPSLEVIGDSDGEGPRLVVGLSYWVEDWDQEMVQTLGQLIASGTLSPLLTQYLIDILRFKTEHIKDAEVRKMLQEILQT